MAENRSSEDMLRYLNDEEAARRIPVMIYLGLVSLFGFVGNVHVLVVFSVHYQPSNFRRFVLCLAAVDLLSCVMAMPFEIFDMRYPYMFFASGVCSAFRYMNTALTYSSVLILLVIAAERFRKICQPLKKQLDASWAKVACVITIIVALLFCIPVAMSNGLKTVNLEKNITGYDCSIRDSVRGTSVPTVVMAMAILIFITATVSLIVMYLCIGIHLTRYKRRLSRFMCNSVPSPTLRIDIASHSNSDGETNHPTETIKKDSNGTKTPELFEGSEADWESGKFKKEKLSRTSSRESPFLIMPTKIAGEAVPKEHTSKTTIIFFMITAIFFITFLPHIILLCLLVLKKEFESNLTQTQDVVYRIAMRLYFLNNAVNPVVYGMYGVKFRNKCKQFYKKLLGFKQ